MRTLAASVIAAFFVYCNGFLHVIPSISSQPSRWHETDHNPMSLPFRKDSKLKMNVLEDFLSGTDKTARKAENDKYIAALMTRVQRINELETTVEELGDDELVAKSQEFKKRLKMGEDINGPLLEEAFSVVREAAWRVLELRHYDVQLLGGFILHDGRIAEMATGEGKTLVATLPCYVNALTGKSAFVITVNDYLARRDMEKMGQVYRFLGLTVGLIQSGMNEEERRKAYACDVVYVTNSELGFDFLRDHLALSPGQTVLPSSFSDGKFDSFCVVDEADSVFIDEARTPLIISKQVPAPASKYKVANTLANALKNKVHYDVDLKNKNVVLNERGYRDSENALGIKSLFETPADGSSAWAPYIMNAIKAKELFQKDIDYSILMNGNQKVGVGIIDAFTGRVLDGRRWSDGLHQSIEAKEGIDVSQQSKVIAKVTYQALFRQFSRLSGMTGTATSDAPEFLVTYGLIVTPVPTALPLARRDYPDVAFKTRKAANKALINEVIAVGGGKKNGRPCLIGTTSIAQSELIVEALAAEGIRAELLNASPKNAARESEIIAQAGRAGVVTVATNMAGRGTDILLGGCGGTMARIKVRSILLSLGMVDSNQASTFFPASPPDEYFPCALDDELVKMFDDIAMDLKKEFGGKMSPTKLEEILTVAIDTTESEDDPLYIIKLRDGVQRIKDSFKRALEDEKTAVKKSGGLYVMGTNRHESRRIDGQLRGRAGRQGDPGSSRFFISFEDDMFVIFGGDGLKNILSSFRVPDEMPVESPQVTNALDKVQAVVEEKYREIREQILNFDDILNDQRRVIYKRRQDILFLSSAATLKLIDDYNKQTVSDIVSAQVQSGQVTNHAKLIEKFGQFFPSAAEFINLADIQDLDRDGIVTFLNAAVEEVFRTKVEDLDKKAQQSGKLPGSLSRSANYILLVSIDNAWSDHLQRMEDLKEAVVLRKYQNRDPVSEYRVEALSLFQGLTDKMRFNAIYSLWQSLN